MKEVVDMTSPEYRKYIFDLGRVPREGFQRKIIYGADGTQSSSTSSQKTNNMKTIKELVLNQFTLGGTLVGVMVSIASGKWYWLPIGAVAGAGVSAITGNAGSIQKKSSDTTEEKSSADGLGKLFKLRRKKGIGSTAKELDCSSTVKKVGCPCDKDGNPVTSGGTGTYAYTARGTLSCYQNSGAIKSKGATIFSADGIDYIIPKTGYSGASGDFIIPKVSSAEGDYITPNLLSASGGSGSPFDYITANLLSAEGKNGGDYIVPNPLS